MDFLVFSHLRWNFVFQRPQHIMCRFAAKNRVFFWEEPVFDVKYSRLEATETAHGVCVLVPHLPGSLSEIERDRVQGRLLMDFVRENKIKDSVHWYYNPMAIRFSRHLNAQAVVYDCMDELSAFRGAPIGLRSAEAALFANADVVFTGGQSLHKSKKTQHNNVHCFPSSIDRDFFQTARRVRVEPADQAKIARPRFGYSGVVDERMDLDLVKSVAGLRPDWHFVMVGPVVKISHSELPKADNIHWLGGKPYAELPSYMAGWDVGILPFARNESTRYISPTKTPEYLTAGLSVISTSIADVVRPYGVKGLVHIADDAATFIAAGERAVAERNDKQRLASVDKFLEQMSWDVTWAGMSKLVENVTRNTPPVEQRLNAPVFSPLPSLGAGD